MTVEGGGGSGIVVEESGVVVGRKRGLTEVGVVLERMGMDAGAAVVTVGLTRRFGRVTALGGVDFVLPAGAILGLLGPNGSGKTTLLSILAGFIAPTAGTFRLLGEEQHRRALARTGVLISRPLLWPHLSCRDNLRCLQGLHTGRQDREEVEGLLEEVGLAGGGASRKFGQCSTGMKQRVGIAAALLGDPELLLLDEPTNGLDPEGMVEVRELIRELGRRPGRAIIMSSHLLNEVERTCDYYAIIHRGRLAGQGRIGDNPAGAAAAGPAISLDTTDNRRAAEHLREKGWTVTAAGEILTVAAAAGTEWQAARDLAEMGIYPRAMYPAADAEPAGTLEQVYLAAVGNREAAE